MRCGTRKSTLARAQTKGAADAVDAVCGSGTEIVPIVTAGDRYRGRFGSGEATKRLFTKEIDAALLDGTIDYAVHSLKDVSVDYPFYLVTPPRSSPFDAFVSPYASIEELPLGARVGTGSPRRASELLRLRPDLRVEPVRGNVDTRLSLLSSLDAVILAEAGLRRLGRWESTPHTYAVLSPDAMMPAPCQGTLALACRQDDEETKARLNRVLDSDTFTCSLAERAFFREIGGGCHLAAGAYATVERDILTLRAAINAPNGSLSLRSETQGPVDCFEALARGLAQRMASCGGTSLTEMNT